LRWLAIRLLWSLLLTRWLAIRLLRQSVLLSRLLPLLAVRLLPILLLRGRSVRGSR
jgi:hypothetical protein